MYDGLQIFLSLSICDRVYQCVVSIIITDEILYFLRIIEKESCDSTRLKVFIQLYSFRAFLANIFLANLAMVHSLRGLVGLPTLVTEVDIAIGFHVYFCYPFISVFTGRFEVSWEFLFEEYL